MAKFQGGVLLRGIAVFGVLMSTHVAFAADSAGPPSVQPSLSASQTTFASTPPIAAPAAVEAEASMSADVRAALSEPDPEQVECVAKVIRHEAANQPVDGQVAVAQVIRARMKDGRFAKTACGVVRQRGQFFDVDAYDPPRGDARWTLAARIAADTLRGDGVEVADGALFFHSAGARMPGRVRVAKIADHTFYR